MIASNYYSKNIKDTYAFFYDTENEFAWVVHMPRLPPGQSGVGREVGSLESIKSKEEAFKKLKEMVDKF